jgi:hypothetical protein
MAFIDAQMALYVHMNLCSLNSRGASETRP